uniref:HTH CENPB-type domain-containing protein n=1 Tax=Pelodiscus sinensis TaxID=13735 RepID=K7FLM3_PELSI
RKSYTADFKLSIVTYAKENGNRAAGKRFSVNEKSVHEWRKEEAETEKLNPHKRARRGKKAKWQNLEVKLGERDSQRVVLMVAIKLKARLMAMEMKINDFHGGSGNWVYKFMRRNNLSVRARTSVGQWLPDEWEKKMDDFKDFVHKEINQVGLKPNNVIKMDEVPTSFNIPAIWSVVATGVKTVSVATISHECTCFTVILVCMAGGEKLKPMVIFKRVTMPFDISVVCHKKSWVNQVMKTWTESCFQARKGGFFNPKSLLLSYALAAHKETSVQKHIDAMGAHIAIIPGGLTCKLQPLDVAVNHPLKCFNREEWENWMTNGEHTFTLAGRQHHATDVEVCKWVLATWERLTPATIRNGFCKCEI